MRDWFTPELYRSQMQEIVDKQKEHREQLLDWNKYVAGLAAGAFAILVALAPPPETALAASARYMLAGAWLCLGVGIAAGTGAIYVEVWIAKALLDGTVDRMTAAINENRPELLRENILAKPPLWLRLCQRVMVVSLLLSVVCLVSYAILRIFA